MSFDLRLDLPGVEEDALRALASRIAEEGAWPIDVLPGGAHIPEADAKDVELFTHTEPAGGLNLWRSPPGAGERLARTFMVLAANAPEGFTFHAAWHAASAVREVEVTGAELAALARESRIDEDTLYLVGRSEPVPLPPRPPRRTLRELLRRR